MSLYDYQNKRHNLAVEERLEVLKDCNCNQILGELYFKTERINLAKERLKILCNCEEY